MAKSIERSLLLHLLVARAHAAAAAKSALACIYAEKRRERGNGSDAKNDSARVRARASHVEMPERQHAISVTPVVERDERARTCSAKAMDYNRIMARRGD